MHYFSIHTQDGEHAGFFIMLADDESQNPPQSGRFAIKLQSEDRIELFFDDKNIGALRNEYLTVSGKTFILTDLTGAM